MSERLLFRGRTIPDSETGDGGGVWVVGYYVVVNGTHYIKDLEAYGWRIDPATIGQCTTLKDFYETLIFESDEIATPNGMASRSTGW